MRRLLNNCCWLPRKFHPCIINPPWNRMPGSQTVRNSAQCGPPPTRFANRPRDSFAARISELPPNTKKRHRNQWWKWTAHEHAPKLVARVLMMSTRSEEHTSELQSLRHLVCRLLLEKKNYNK